MSNAKMAETKLTELRRHLCDAGQISMPLPVLALIQKADQLAAELLTEPKSEPPTTGQRVTRLKRQNAKFRKALTLITRFQWSHDGVRVNQPRTNCYCGPCCMARTASSVLPKPRKKR